MLEKRRRPRLKHTCLRETRSEQPEGNPSKRNDLEAAANQQTAQFPVVQIEPPVAGSVGPIPHEPSDPLPHRPGIPVIVENQDAALGQDIVDGPNSILAQLVLRVPEKPERGHQLHRLDAGGLVGQVPQQKRGPWALGSGLCKHRLRHVDSVRLDCERGHQLGDPACAACEVEVARYALRKRPGDCLKQEGALASGEEGVERVVGQRGVVVGTPLQMRLPIVRAPAPALC